MLNIRHSVYSELEHVFLLDKHEQGFILGSMQDYNSIDFCKLIPARQSGEYFYTPDNLVANMSIWKWGNEGICFSGFIHSHTKGQKIFSEDDILFCHQLLSNYRVPYLWFGLGIITAEKTIKTKFYKACKQHEHLLLHPVAVKIIRTNNMT